MTLETVLYDVRDRQPSGAGGSGHARGRGAGAHDLGKAPIPIAMAKSALESGAQSDLTTAMALETASTVACFLTEDAREGARAFVEKRPPKYYGR
jgi:enoyl-CoA hydratase